MIKSERNKGSKAKDVNVVCQWKEETQRKNQQKKLARHKASLFHTTQANKIEPLNYSNFTHPCFKTPFKFKYLQQVD
jgi:hypothetical protein